MQAEPEFPHLPLSHSLPFVRPWGEDTRVLEFEPHETEEDEMQDFLLIYQGGDPAWAEKPQEEIARVMQQWGAWFKELEASGNLRNPGAPLAPEGTVLTRSGAGIATDTISPEVKELIGGYSVLQARSLEEAVELAKGSPFLLNQPTGQIMVRPVYAPVRTGAR